jgi:hypothetical protein
MQPHLRAGRQELRRTGMKGETPEALVERILEDSKMLEQVVENEDRSPLEMQFTRDLLDATFRLG